MSIMNFQKNHSTPLLAVCGTMTIALSIVFLAQTRSQHESVVGRGLGNRSPPLADGCHHVFIDAGSNIGVHGRFLFEPEKYPDNKFGAKFDEIFGPDRKSQDICVFAFEPNPIHAQRQGEIAASYQKMGWRYHFMPYAVMDEDGQLEFARNSDSEPGKDEHEEWGFGITQWKTGKDHRKETVVVKGVDFSVWLADNIFSRTLPTRSSKHNSGQPTVFMKMDIEGAEFKVLSKMVRDGTMCNFDHIVGESHPMTGFATPHKDLVARYDAKGLDIIQKRDAFIESLNDVLSASGCATFDFFDDESYLHDGAVLPTIS